MTSKTDKIESEKKNTEKKVEEEETEDEKKSYYRRDYFSDAKQEKTLRYSAESDAEAPQTIMLQRAVCQGLSKKGLMSRLTRLVKPYYKQASDHKIVEFVEKEIGISIHEVSYNDKNLWITDSLNGSGEEVDEIGLTVLKNIRENGFSAAREIWYSPCDDEESYIISWNTGPKGRRYEVNKKAEFELKCFGVLAVDEDESSVQLMFPKGCGLVDVHELIVCTCLYLSENLEDFGSSTNLQSAWNSYCVAKTNEKAYIAKSKLTTKELERMDKQKKRQEREGLTKDFEAKKAKAAKQVEEFCKTEEFKETFLPNMLTYKLLFNNNIKMFDFKSYEGSVVEYYAMSSNENSGKTFLKVRQSLNSIEQMEKTLEKIIVKHCPDLDLNWTSLEEMNLTRGTTKSLAKACLDSARSLTQNLWWPLSLTYNYVHFFLHFEMLEKEKGWLIINYWSRYKPSGSIESNRRKKTIEGKNFFTTDLYATINEVKNLKNGVVNVEESYAIFLTCGLNTIQLQKFAMAMPDEYLGYVKTLAGNAYFVEFFKNHVDLGLISSFKDFNKIIAKFNLATKDFCKKAYLNGLKNTEERRKIYQMFNKTPNKKVLEEAKAEKLITEIAKTFKFAIATKDARWKEEGAFETDSVFKTPAKVTVEGDEETVKM